MGEKHQYFSSTICAFVIYEKCGENISTKLFELRLVTIMLQSPNTTYSHIDIKFLAKRLMGRYDTIAHEYKGYISQNPCLRLMIGLQ
jgi:hypothetical protein